MTPQLFINYKLKSVAHMPWKAFTYKALNTFIDDLFAFVIKMPWMHRIACFRDGKIFVYHGWYINYLSSRYFICYLFVSNVDLSGWHEEGQWIRTNIWKKSGQGRRGQEGRYTGIHRKKRTVKAKCEQTKLIKYFIFYHFIREFLPLTRPFRFRLRFSFWILEALDSFTGLFGFKIFSWWTGLRTYSWYSMCRTIFV